MLQDKAYSRSLTSSKTKIRLDRRIFMTGEETKTTPQAVPMTAGALALLSLSSL